MTTTGHDEKIDGRSLRAERSRQAAVEAVLDLLEEGGPDPTAQRVADRSGVSLSTIFRLYEDLDALHAAAIATQGERVAPMIVEFRHDAALEERIRQLVDNRARLYEAISPVRRFAKRLAPSSERIGTHLRLFDDFLRRQALGLFDRELSADATVYELVDALTSWDTWERLRVGQGLSIRRAKSAVATGLLRALAG